MLTKEDNENRCDGIQPYDHIYLPCNAGGVPYNHHAIVLAVSPPNDDERFLCVADITADGTSSSAASSGTLHKGLSPAITTVDSFRGLRVYEVAEKEWQKVHYDAEVSPRNVVRERVEFLLNHPEALPTYSLVESNCECVAVWCKTGEWKTLQATAVLTNLNHGARTILGLSALCQPFLPGIPLLAGLGVATELVSGRWFAHASKQWEEHSRKLNVEFGQLTKDSPDTEDKGEASETHVHVLDPFSDSRSLRELVELGTTRITK